METATKTYACEMAVAEDKTCGKTGPAADMWNIGKRHTGGKLVILCGKHAHAARKEDLRVFRLAGTLEREAEFAAKEAAERQASSAFFQGLKRFQAEDGDGDRRRHGHDRSNRRGGGRTLHEEVVYGK